MKTANLTDKQKAALRRDALVHVIPHFASKESLARGPKIFVRGIGLLWAVILDGNGRALGNRISDWCCRRGMILRNNGEILVLAPSLINTRDEAEWVVELMDRALTAACEEAAP